MQQDANAYARETFRTLAGLGGIPEADFRTAADAIVGALVRAWAAGYQARDEEGARR
jgi:hypothetical protein